MKNNLCILPPLCRKHLGIFLFFMNWPTIIKYYHYQICLIKMQCKRSELAMHWQWTELIWIRMGIQKWVFYLVFCSSFICPAPRSAYRKAFTVNSGTSSGTPPWDGSCIPPNWCCEVLLQWNIELFHHKITTTLGNSTHLHNCHNTTKWNDIWPYTHTHTVTHKHCTCNWCPAPLHE